MIGEDDLEDLFGDDSGEDNAETKPEAPVSEKPDPVETGVNTENVAEPPSDDDSKSPSGEVVPRAALEDERKKRQNLEKTLEEKIKFIEERLNQSSPKPEAPTQAEVDWFTSPEAAAQDLQYQFEERMYQAAVYNSEMYMREKYQDYDELSQLFVEAAQKDPQLAQQVFRHPAPAQFAYQVGQQLKLLNEINSDPISYREKLKEELRKELMASEGESEETSQSTNRTPSRSNPAPVPRSLGSDTSRVTRGNRRASESFSLSEILDE